MTTKQIELVKTTSTIVGTIDPVTVGGLFYGRLFEIAPELKPLFKTSIQEQSRKLLSMIGYVINNLDKLDDIIDEVGKLSQRHLIYGVKPEDYGDVGEALLWTLEKGLGENWNDEVKEAWTTCYTILSEAMIDASGYAKHEVA